MTLARRSLMLGLGALGMGAALPACRRESLVCPEPSAPVEASEPPQPSPEVPGSDGPDFSSLEGFCDGLDPIASSEYEVRIEGIRQRLVEAKQGALIVEAGTHMRYLGGPRWGLSERPLLLVIPVEAEPFLLGPVFEAGTLEARQGARRYRVLGWNEHESPYARVEAELEAAKIGAKAPLALGGVTRSFIGDGLREAAPKRRVSSALGIIEDQRRVKSAAELALLRRANEATKAALSAAARHARPGMHEREFAAIVREAQQRAGLEQIWVLALFGPNAAYPHGTPEGRELAEGDLILVDTGGFLHGYASDITRTWAFPDPGVIDADRRSAWEVVREAQSAALAEIRPGASCAMVDAAARRVVAAAGFDPDYGDFSHRLGHGIGMEVHEQPYLVRESSRVLEPGNTMSDEPGLYLPGRFGVRLEDIVAVTESGAEVFGPRANSLEDPFGERS